MKKIIFISVLALCSSLFAQEHIVNQQDKQFQPTKISVKVGDTLVFKNSDSYAHNAYTDDEANEFDIGMQAPDKNLKVDVKAAGTFTIECAIHPSMMLEVEAK